MRQRRLEMGLTQVELGVRIDTPQSAIAYYEGGKFPGERLGKLADALDVSIDWLMGRTDKPTGEFMSAEQASSRDAQLLLSAWNNQAFLDVIRMALEQAQKGQRVTPFDGAK